MTSSQHRFPNRNYRPDPDEYDPVKKAVEKAGHDMNRLVRAFLRHFKENPDRVLEELAPHMDDIAASTPRGRPKAAASE